MRTLLFIIFILNLFNSSFAFERSISLAEFQQSGAIAGLERMNMPTRMIKLTLQELWSIKLTDNPDYIGAYRPLTNTLYLGADFIDQNKKLKSFSSWGASLVDTLYHEIWHAYKDLLLTTHNYDVSVHFDDSIYRLYNTYDDTYHNEAYGLYFGHIAANYFRNYQTISKLAPEARKKYCNNINIQHSYFDSYFKAVINGYKAKGNGEVITSNVDLPFNDRALILMQLLDNQLKLSFSDAFHSLCNDKNL